MEVAHLWDAVLTKFLTCRVVQPMVRFSLKSFGRPKDDIIHLTRLVTLPSEEYHHQSIPVGVLGGLCPSETRIINQGFPYHVNFLQT